MNGENNGTMNNGGIETINFAQGTNNNIQNTVPNPSMQPNMQTANDIQSQMMAPFANVQPQNSQPNTVTQPVANDLNTQINNQSIINSQPIPQQNNIPMNDINSQQIASSNLGVPEINNQNNILDPQPVDNFSQQFVQSEQQYSETTSDNDNQKSGLGFIIIVFVVLAAFIIALPYITRLF